MVFVGVDWAETHHDVCLLDEQGKALGKRRIPDGWRACAGCLTNRQLYREDLAWPTLQVVA